ncbi:MAG TPA: inositol monophosphatase family protein [Candidatus Acidoferrales bacterium]|nr:inositol monophosphatase family protein [Candidatus Acidoferrales bacterium]
MTTDRFDLARDAARQAGALLRAKLGTHLLVRSKDIRSNLVTEADTQSEALIRSLVAQRFPEDVFLGEESGSSGSDRGHRWIVDPLDGTTNYAHGYRCFCVSIALEREGVVVAGIVYDPMADEEFVARLGQGATCNGTQLRVSERDDIGDALLVTGFPAHRVDDPVGNLGPFADFTRVAQALRRDGSAALDLCYVAAGRFDGFWEPGLHAWDVAAGMLIVAEAGGTVSDYRGGRARIDAGELVASNGKIHEAMLAVLQSHRS